MLETEINSFLPFCSDTDTRASYEARICEGRICREENLHSHFCTYFVPYNPINQTVLIGDHKKSGLWLLPGGHIEPNESILTTLNREIEEELGVSNFFSNVPTPFLCTITHINSDVRPCKEHFDIWFVLETDGGNFVIDYSEYHEVRWVSLPEAKKLTTDPANQLALEKLNGIY